MPIGVVRGISVGSGDGFLTGVACLALIELSMIKFFAAAEDDIEPADEAGRDDKDQVSSCPLELKLAEELDRWVDSLDGTFSNLLSLNGGGAGLDFSSSIFLFVFCISFSRR